MAQRSSAQQDIAEHGLREPIVMHEGMILDGRNRFRACQEVGVPLRTVDYDGDDPKAYVISLNLHRRHLTESQRAMVAARLADLPKHANRFTIDAQICASTSQTEAADLLNVSRRAVQHANKVQSAGVAELVAAVDSGDLSVSAAAEIASLPKPEQAEVIARGEADGKQAIIGRRWGYSTRGPICC